ncbi:hypothetical protein BYT27DRAFT_7209170 [Phlegmacium glaucopus]|nr:hypothetical protein BYT27DRAFT_7209170 [Phlegmacium glaucopus]
MEALWVAMGPADFSGYLSDLSTDEEDDETDSDWDDVTTPVLPPAKRLRKRTSLVVPAQVAHIQGRELRDKEFQEGLTAIEKLVKSSGKESLQAHRARAILSHLQMVVKGKRRHIEASEIAAEAQGFARKWGGHLVRRWVWKWIQRRELPVSLRGQHVKAFTLLDDPVICAELRAFVRSNKWSMNPEKLAAYSKTNMVTVEAAKYICHAVNKEMPEGLKKYLEVELFPRIQMKAANGISLRTARRWLYHEGFRYTEHKKSLYYDGHDRPDVLAYRQNEFLPKLMKEHRRRMVEYVIGDTEKEVVKLGINYVEQQLVLVAHDEMTTQANDGMKKSWILEGEHALKKKGVGRGMHQSDVICLTHGWMKEASQSLEYGKNYEGYWTGELFVKQLEEKIIPVFKRLHGPGYQALIMVDNSQGHSAYSVDALVVSRMNMKPGGKQARMRNGWYMQSGVKIAQPMIFPSDHPEFLDMPKGIKQVLTE